MAFERRGRRHRFINNIPSRGSTEKCRANQISSGAGQYWRADGDVEEEGARPVTKVGAEEHHAHGFDEVQLGPGGLDLAIGHATKHEVSG